MDIRNETQVISKWNVTQVLTEPGYYDVIVSQATLSIFAEVVDLWMSLVVALVGVVTNVLTIAVFFRMGFRDSVNITMTTIAFWDLTRSLCGTLYRLCGPISWFSVSLGRAWQNITVTNIVYLNIISGNVSYVIGGYVALERCLCVSLPFKVKAIVTPRVTLAICVALSLIVFATLFPIMLTLEYRWVAPVQGGTPFVIYQFTDFYHIYGPSFMEVYKYLSFVYPIVSLTAMVISTLIIAFHLQTSSQFRTSACTVPREGSSESKTSSKESQIIRMLLVVILSHIVVLVPRVVHYVVEIFEPEYYILKRYNNIFWLVVYFIFLLDFVNSAVGFFIFYAMGSKFRKTFDSMFRRPGCCARNKH